MLLQYLRKPDKDSLKIWAQMSECNDNETNKYVHANIYSAINKIIVIL